jgi:hypothetical protein
MKSLNLGRYALCSCVATAMLAGCGGSQPPVGAPGAMPQRPAQQGLGVQRPAAEAQQRNGASWLAPEAKHRDLLYVPDYNYSVVGVYSYPDAKPLGDLKVTAPYGVCSDKNGNVFIASAARGQSSVSQIFEYPHGGTTPIATLQDPNAEPAGCAIDPSTGNLAVANVYTQGTQNGDVVVYSGATGSPVSYSVPNINQAVFCTYDASGNLYVEGANTRLETTVFGVLRKGQQNFTNFTVNGPVSIWGLASARNNLVVGGYELSSEDAAYIYQVRVSGSSGTIVRKILVDGFRLDYGITIKDGYLLMTMDAVRIGRFYYPSGREAGFGRHGRHGGPGGDFVPDETISVAPRA